MAIYYPVTSWMKVSESFKIKSTVQGDFTMYVITISIPPYSWTCEHRYSEFRELHEKLVSQYTVNKSILPPKKIFGSQSEGFIKKRQADLELYLQTVIHHHSKLPPPIMQFLDFHHYEVCSIIEHLAELLFFQGDEILKSDNEFILSPLQLHALMERLKLAEPTCVSGDKKRDLGHVLDFVSQLKHLTIKGSNEVFGTSNIVPNNLPYDMVPFKSLKTLTILNSQLKNNLRDVSNVRKTVKKIMVHNSLENLESILLGDIVHWSPTDSPTYWPWWKKVVNVDFSQNSLSTIDPCIKLLPSIETLDLSNNSISGIENLESLPHLNTLDLSHNQIFRLEALHIRLGNIRILSLANNSISALQGLSRLYSLVVLDLSDNQIESVQEVSHLSKLPCLEVLKMISNPVTKIVDYRAQTLLHLGRRAFELCLDDQKVSQKELDKVAVLQALQAAKEGRVLSQSSFHETYRDRESLIGTSSNTDLVIVPKEYRDGSGTVAECSIKPNPHTEEFRQQVAALRRLGGSDWLRLLNQLQKETFEARNVAQEKTPSIESDDFCLDIDVSAPCSSKISKCFFSEHGSSGNILLPDWLFKFGLSNTSFRSHILEKIQSKSVEGSHLGNTRTSNGETPFCIIWVLAIWGQDSACAKFPACLLLSSTFIYMFRLENFSCSNNSQNASCFDLPEPQLSLRATLLPSNIKNLASGPQESYLELHWTEGGRLLKLVLMTTNSQKKDLLSKLQSHYGLQIESKYAVEEFIENLRHAILTYHCNEGSLKLGQSELKFILCEPICRVQLEDFLGAGRKPKQQNTATLLVVTSQALLMVEESVILPVVNPLGPFKVLAALEISSYVHSIQMKDGGKANHVCCCHEYQRESKQEGDRCCFLHELYSCGYWLLIDFEGNFSLKVRFFCREARSRFLEAFLASRNQKL